MTERRHGEWPLLVPPEHGSEQWRLCEQMASVMLPRCVPECDAMCVCPDDTEDPGVGP